jgi:hypothetical protein
VVAGVDHQGEVQNREHQHHTGRRELGDAFEHHRTDLRRKATEQGENNRDDDQGNQRGQALGHDQEHERDDHGKAKESQHGNTPGVARLGEMSEPGEVSAEREARVERAELKRRGGLRRTSGSPLLLLNGPCEQQNTRVGQPVCCRE